MNREISCNEGEISYKDSSYKYIFLGDSGVGKSSIVKKFLTQRFSNGEGPTIGVAYHTKVLTAISNKTNKPVNVLIHIWDTCGQERYRSIVKSYYRNAKCAIFVFDVTDRWSFINIMRWLDDMNGFTEGCLLYLIGNKIDLTDNIQVTYEEAYKFASLNNMTYMECSAKTGDNILFLFSDSVNKLVNMFPPKETTPNSFIISNHNKPKYCCY